MTTSYYEEIIMLHDNNATQDAVKNKLIEIGIFDLFEPAWLKYNQAGIFEKIVYYTAYSYSWESKLLIIGQDPIKYKTNISNKIGLSKQVAEELINLKDRGISTMFLAYLNLYQNNLDFTHLESYKLLYKSVMDDINNYKELSKDANSDDDSDYLDEKIKRMEKAEKMLSFIKKYEEKIKKDYRAITIPEQELSENLSRKDNFQVTSLAIENSPSIISKSNG